MNYSVEYNYLGGRLFFLLVEKEPHRVVGPVGRQELEQRRASLTTLHSNKVLFRRISNARTRLQVFSGLTMTQREGAILWTGQNGVKA